MSGVRVEFEIEDPIGCPLAMETGPATAKVQDRVHDEDTVVEEVSVDRTLDETRMESVDDDATVYRMERPNTGTCICDRLRGDGHPVSEATVDDGDLYITLYLSEAADFETIVERIQETGSTVSVRSLTRGGTGRDDGDTVRIDRGRLTDRQREVLETALEMGYYEYPRAANATEVGEELGLTASTVVEHLTLAEAKLFDDAFDT